MSGDSGRRPIRTRSSLWAGSVGGWLARCGCSANALSVLGIGFAALAAFLLWSGAGPWALVGAALSIQLRLICNLLDGLVAVEGGRGTKVGVLYNEFPDRIEDALILVAAGASVGQERLGWACAVLAVMTAQARSFTGCVGQAQDFGGPMAKQHRMAVVTLACLTMAALTPWSTQTWPMEGGLWVVCLGSALTWWLRLRRMALGLEQG